TLLCARQGELSHPLNAHRARRAICNGLDESGRVACLHRAPLALAPFVIRWGAQASSNVMRQRLRCAVCGHRGAVLQHPSWIDAQSGEQPFPAEWAAIAACSREEDPHLYSDWVIVRASKG